jgi:RNA polymerase sigma-70 factor (ECF subfamily)
MVTEFPETRSTLLAQVRSPENREAWEQFVLVYRPVIYRMARRRGMQDADAQDLVQTVLMRVAGAIDRRRLPKCGPNGIVG